MQQRTITISTCMLLIMLAAVPNASAAICNSTGTLQDLINLGATGCTLGPGNDKIFNNFQIIGGVGSSSGGGIPAPTGSSVTYSVENPGTSTGSGQLVYGFFFNPNLNVTSPGGFVFQDINIAYDITLTAAAQAAGTRISSIHLLQNDTISGNAQASVGETDIGCVTLTSCNTFSVTTTDANKHQDILTIAPGLISLHVNKDMNVNANGGGSAAMSSVRDSVDQSGTSAVPEPTTVSYLLLGGGMLIVGFLRQRRAS